MAITSRLLVFSLNEQRYGLDVATVERVERMVEIHPLPQSPDIVAGIINMRGRIIPIINVRQRFRQPQRGFALSDQIIIAHTKRRTVGLVVDGIVAISEYPNEDIAGAKDILPAMEYVKGVVKMRDGLVLIHDLEKFLSVEEESCLDRAIEASR
ncbi:MAG: chemotaxis protein CheW [Pseudomonadota bacterium]